MSDLRLKEFRDLAVSPYKISDAAARYAINELVKEIDRLQNMTLPAFEQMSAERAWKRAQEATT